MFIKYITVIFNLTLYIGFFYILKMKSAKTLSLHSEILLVNGSTIIKLNELEPMSINLIFIFFFFFNNFILNIFIFYVHIFASSLSHFSFSAISLHGLLSILILILIFICWIFYLLTFLSILACVVHSIKFEYFAFVWGW